MGRRERSTERGLGAWSTYLGDVKYWSYYLRRAEVKINGIDGRGTGHIEECPSG